MPSKVNRGLAFYICKKQSPQIDSDAFKFLSKGFVREIYTKSNGYQLLTGIKTVTLCSNAPAAPTNLSSSWLKRRSFNDFIHFVIRK
jgi:hypothetical protein